ncbi:hypothetical protein ACT8ZV_05345 [Nocardioides sp. MAHUQ-72]
MLEQPEPTRVVRTLVVPRLVDTDQAGLRDLTAARDAVISSALQARDG